MAERVGGPLRIGHECLAARTPFPPERIPVVGSLTIDNINSFALWMKVRRHLGDETAKRYARVVGKFSVVFPEDFVVKYSPWHYNAFRLGFI